MIACQDVQPACSIAIETSDESDANIRPTPRELTCPRTAEILTVLNDVFDAICLPGESGILSGAGAA